MGTMRIFGLVISVIVIAIVAILSLRKRHQTRQMQPAIGDVGEIPEPNSAIVSVKRVNGNQKSIVTTTETPTRANPNMRINPENIVVIHVLPNPGHNFVGYELLQALLSAGLRYGDMQIFHRYQHLNDPSNSIFSVAQATEPGIFDIHNMGAVVCRGLIFIMPLNQDPIDLANFQLMLDTAKELAQELDGVLCDGKRQPLTDEGLFKLQQRVYTPEEEALSE